MEIDILFSKIYVIEIIYTFSSYDYFHWARWRFNVNCQTFLSIHTWSYFVEAKLAT